MPIPINLVFEDVLSEYVLIQLLNCFESKFESAFSYNGRGFGYIKSRINGFNQASAFTPFLVLTDLDTNPCPLKLINDWFKKPLHNNMIFRVAVKEVESWLLADIEGFANYIGIAKRNFPPNPDIEPDPKRKLISLVRKSRIRNIREDIIPLNDNASIGPNYNERLMEFVFYHWDIKRAMQKSESPRRAYNHLLNFKFIVP